jgi:putative restriction endonuclease
MQGTVAVTDSGWYEFLAPRIDITEVNFWRPSARRGFSAPQFSPFLFKLKSPYNAICGFAYFATYSRLPVWLAWEVFGQGNGCESLQVMVDRLERIRTRIGYERPADEPDAIGCTLLVNPIFFPRDRWIPQPDDWPERTQTDKRYQMDVGEGSRIWTACLDNAAELSTSSPRGWIGNENRPRYGAPYPARARLGQRTFQIAVTDAYRRACAITGEHSLPALQAGHIYPYSEGGDHRVPNGILLRADIHRLFDKGYITITPDYTIRVSDRLRTEYHNGRSYFPLHGQRIQLPHSEGDKPDKAVLEWHSSKRFVA